MGKRRHILIIRLSALGDVAILQPLLKKKMASADGVTVTVAAPEMLSPLFSGIPGVDFLGVDKSLGNLGMFRKMASCRPTSVADIHGVNRTFIIDFLFMVLRMVPVHVIHKQYRQRKEYLGGIGTSLLPSWRLYDDVLVRAGLAADAGGPDPIRPKPSADGRYRIGIAPYATFSGKQWPFARVEKLVGMLTEDPSVEVSLFGGRGHAEEMSALAGRYERCRAVYGIPFNEELELISRLNVMVSMDSANMHFASCFGVPVVSVWGATSPECGFYGWGQDPDWAVQTDMECRPCSIFGKKTCPKGTYGCLGSITAAMVCDKVRALLVRT